MTKSVKWTISEIKNLIELYKYYKLPIFEIKSILNKNLNDIVYKLIELRLVTGDDPLFEILFILRTEINNRKNPIEELYQVQNNLNKRISMFDKQ